MGFMKRLLLPPFLIGLQTLISGTFMPNAYAVPNEIVIPEEAGTFFSGVWKRLPWMDNEITGTAYYRGARRGGNIVTIEKMTRKRYDSEWSYSFLTERFDCEND